MEAIKDVWLKDEKYVPKNTTIIGREINQITGEIRYIKKVEIPIPSKIKELRKPNIFDFFVDSAFLNPSIANVILVGVIYFLYTTIPGGLLLYGFKHPEAFKLTWYSIMTAITVPTFIVGLINVKIKEYVIGTLVFLTKILILFFILWAIIYCYIKSDL